MSTLPARERQRPDPLTRTPTWDARAPVDADVSVPAAEIAYRKLREGILRGDLPIGSLLLQEALARKLGMSRTPVRRALHMLLEEGLVERAPGRQLAVRGLSRRICHEVIVARTALERVSVAGACRSAAPEDIDYLRLLLLRQRRAVAAGDGGLFVDIDEQFHLAIASRSKMLIVYGLLTHLGNYMRLMGIVAASHPERMAAALLEHAAIFDAIEARDTARAIAALEIHLRATEETLART